MASLKKVFLIFFLIVSKNSLAQSDLRDKANLRLQVTFEEQSYLERSFHDSKYYDIEKNAGFCTTYNLTFNKGLILDKRFLLIYGLGVKLVNQEYDFTEIASSVWNYFEMGTSSVKSLYLSGSAKIFYKKPNTDHFYLSPFIGLELNVPVAKNERLISLKTGFNTLITPEFTFKRVVPEVSVGFLCFYNPNNFNYGFAFGPSINNNAKYFREKVGILSFPLSFSLSLMVIRKG